MVYNVISQFLNLSIAWQAATTRQLVERLLYTLQHYCPVNDSLTGGNRLF